MDILIYEKQTRKVIVFFKNAILHAESGTLDNKYVYKTMADATKFLEEKGNGDILYTDKKKKRRGKILYLEDYRKPYWHSQI